MQQSCVCALDSLHYLVGHVLFCGSGVTPDSGHLIGSEAQLLLGWFVGRKRGHWNRAKLKRLYTGAGHFF